MAKNIDNTKKTFSRIQGIFVFGENYFIDMNLKILHIDTCLEDGKLDLMQ